MFTTDRRRFLMGSLAALVGFFIPRKIRALARLKTRHTMQDVLLAQPLQGPVDQDYVIPFKVVNSTTLGPWRISVTDTPTRHYDEVIEEEVFDLPLTSKLRFLFRDRLFCEIQPSSAGIKTLHGTFWVDEKLKKLKAFDYTPHWMYYVYQTDPHIHEAIHALANHAITQKPMKDWSRDDIVYFRGDPIGSIIYDIAYDRRDRTSGRVMVDQSSWKVREVERFQHENPG